MRCCENCYNGHHNLSDRGEEMYCDETGYMEEEVTPEYCCESHRYIPGCEEEKNYLLYDDSKEEPGFYIITKQETKIIRYLKIYLIHKQGYPDYGIRSYNPQTKISSDYTFETMEFSVRDIEDDENGLYEVFSNFCSNIEENLIKTVDKKQGNSFLSGFRDSYVTSVIVGKDRNVQMSEKNVMDINLGDVHTCEYFDEIVTLYNELSRLKFSIASKEDKAQIKEAESQVKYIDRFYEEEFTAYDFVTLFSAICASKNQYEFDRKELLEYIKHCQKNHKYDELVQGILIKSNGVFDSSENFDEAIAKLKWAGVLYTISPEQDAKAYIFENTPYQKLIDDRQAYADRMLSFFESFKAFGTPEQAILLEKKFESEKE